MTRATKLTEKPEEAARVLLAGGVVAFPTETVYGLGANAFDRDAVLAIFRAKGRPGDNPLIVHIHDRAQVVDLARRVTTAAAKLIARFFPGPLTVILPRRSTVPDEVVAGLDTVGIRMPSHPVTRQFLRACGVPVAAPSANRSGRPSPTAWEAVRDDLSGRVDCILRGGRSPVGLESTVVDCTGRVPVVLRPGAVTIEQLKAAIPSARLATAKECACGRSPGLKHRHYAPEAEVVLVEPGATVLAADPRHAAWIGLHAAPPGIRISKRCGDSRAYAREVFQFFRVCEGLGVRTICCERVPERGIGVALMDRLRRAAEARVSG